MDISQLLNAVFGISVNISIEITLPMMLAVLGAFHFRRKISEKRTKDKTAPLQVITKENFAHLQIDTKDRATCPKLQTKDKSITNFEN